MCTRMRATSSRTHKDISGNVFLLFVMCSLGTVLSTALLAWGFPLLRFFLECGIERNHPDFHANIVRHTNTENRSGVSGKTYTQPGPRPPAPGPRTPAPSPPLSQTPSLSWWTFLPLSSFQSILRLNGQIVFSKRKVPDSILTRLWHAWRDKLTLLKGDLPGAASLEEALMTS